ncbi:MAG: hypothetical protein ACK45H_05935 [Bacteroidota bacterium]
MRKLMYFLSLLFSGLLLTSCSEELNMTGDFKETVVVHGLLDQSDSIHFIKINRAFIGPGDATSIAQIPDSSYFTDLVATVKEYIGSSTTPTRTWTLQDTLIDNKESGVFYAPQQKVYYFHTIGQQPLNDEATYHLDLSLKGGTIQVHGETRLVKDISSPTSSQNFQFKFVDNNGIYIPTAVTAAVGNSSVMNAKLRIAFNEYRSGVPTLKTFDWNLGEVEVEENTNQTFTANGETFYNLIKANVTEDPLIDQRRFVSISAIFTGGSQELYNYMSVNKPSSSLAQNKPTYTNLTISGEARVIGIFSSRNTLTYTRPFYLDPGLPFVRCINTKSTQELCIGQITGSLLFCSQHIADQAQSWYCD